MPSFGMLRRVACNCVNGVKINELIYYGTISISESNQDSNLKVWPFVP
jgi:hypothetical protein